MCIKLLKHRKRQHGYSLVELMITIGIFSIMLAIAVPMFKAGADRRLKAATRDLWANIRFARMESVKRRTDIGIQFNTGAYTPAGTVGNYVIFVDDGTGTGATAADRIQNGSETTIKTVQMPQDVSLISTTFTNNSLGYNSRALPNGINTGNIQLRNTRTFYKLTLSQAGSFQIESSSDNGATWSEN